MQDLLLYLLGVLILVAGLAVSIGLHEVGHLLPAKKFGVKVNQYMIGFGPTLWSKKKGETEYGFKAIPLGGYVSMIGMYPPKAPGGAARNASTSMFSSVIDDARDASNEEVEEGDENRTFYNLPVYKKIIVMLGGPFMNLILAFIFMAIVVSGFGVPQATTTVQTVSECLVPASSESVTECTDEMPAAPAAEAGILPGDKITIISGVVIAEWEDLLPVIADSAETPLTVTIERNGETLDLTVVPAANERYVYGDSGEVLRDASGNPVTATVGMIGVTPQSETVRLPLTEVPAQVFENIKAVSQIVLNLPQRMVKVWNAAFGSADRDLDTPVSVVGVGRIAGEIVSLDEVPLAAKAQSMVGLLASLNVALFVFNLVPLLPLDGGHVAGALYEGAKRRLWRLFGKEDPGPVDTAKMVPVTLTVASLFIGMTLLLVYADIVKPVSIFN